MEAKLKSNNQIYNEVMDMIRKETSINKLKDILIETIDNSPADYDCVSEIYINYIQELD